MSPRQSNGGMVSGPQLAVVLKTFPGSVLVPVDELPARGRAIPPSPPPLERPVMSTSDPTREPPAGPPAATRPASRPSSGAEPRKIDGQQLAAVIEELLADVDELFEAAGDMYDHLIKQDPDRAARKGWVRLRAALDKIEPWALVHAQKTLSDPAAERIQNPAAPTDTQEKAGLTALPTSGSARLAVLDVLAYAQPDATDEEIAEITQLSMNTVRPRRGELVSGGWVEDSGLRRPTAAGNDSIVWRVSIPGREKLGLPPRA